jgi:hypothetical protein
MNPTTPRSLLPLMVVAVTALLAACVGPGGSIVNGPVPQSSSPAQPAGLGPDDCGTRLSTPSPSRTGTDIASPSPDPKGDTAGEPDRHAAPELESLLPETLTGVGYTVESFRWEAGAPDTLTPLVGKRPENMCYADAMPLDPSRLPVGILIYRIVGVPAVQLRAAMLKSWNGVDVPPSEQAVGGKQVIQIQMRGSPMACCSNGPEYLYADGEALFVVLPADADAAATVLSALP